MPSNDGAFQGDGSFRLGVLAVCGLVFAGGLYLRFHGDVPMPKLPSGPAPASAASLRSLDFSVNVFRALVEKDAIDAGVPAPGADELEQLFPYDVAEPHRVLTAFGPALETRDLAIALRVDRPPTGGGDQLVLHIENKTDRHVAYHVDTRPSVDPHACVDKIDIPHDAMALAPHEAIDRTECGLRPGAPTAVFVDRVETLVVPALSYHYVSRLFPPHIGLDSRATRGHVPPKGAICSDIPEQAIRRGLEKGEVSWRDVVDFYARESCAKFIFPVGYRAFTRAGERSLPVPQKGVAGPL
jgi:hypothetical protein